MFKENNEYGLKDCFLFVVKKINIKRNDLNIAPMTAFNSLFYFVKRAAP